MIWKRTIQQDPKIDDIRIVKKFAILQKSHEKDTKSLVWYMNHAGQYELKQKVTKSLFV